MTPPQDRTASQAAAQLDVSVKALRTWERYGLLQPRRTAAGWRLYSPGDIRRASKIAALRSLGFGLDRIGRMLHDGVTGWNDGLAAQEILLRRQARQLALTIDTVRRLRQPATKAEPRPGGGDRPGPAIDVDLPWPWCGERFRLDELRPLTFITGPLGSGKTRLARCLAEALPDARFIGLDRLSDAGPRQHRDRDPALASRVERVLARLVADGAVRSEALSILVTILEARRCAVLVVDMVEEGLGAQEQAALVAHLRRRAEPRPALILMTRSSSVLDLDATGPDEAVLFCPPNHSPPVLVSTRPGGPGYEAAASCLATPAVRARSAGIVAVRGPGRLGSG